jgi:hypothetical protein
MKLLFVLLVSILLVYGIAIPVGYAQEKLAQTGFDFLSVGTDARATGMGESFTTIEGSSTAMFYNPAGIAGLNTFLDISTSQMKWLADIKYLSGAVAFAPYEGRYGVIGISLMNINYGDFKFTQVANNDQGYVDLVGMPKPNAYVVGLGYGKALSNRFSIGGQVKWASQNLGQGTVQIFTKRTDNTGKVVQDTTYDVRNYTAGVFAFDFGTIYKTGLKSLAFGVSVNNFSREIKYERESFQLPLSFKIGISVNVMDLVPDLSEDHSFYVSVDAVHPRAYPEFVNIGGEYVFSKTVSLRVGYISHHPEYGLTAGFGVQKFGVGLDYSYMPHKIFNDIQRLSVRFAL